LLLAASLRLTAQEACVFCCEATVPRFTLLEVLTLRSGERGRDAKAWNERRPPESLAMYQTDVFGKCPARRRR
jgi:hypothetical protein